MGVPYTDAARCPLCDMRATLDRASADAIARVSRGRLESYECPLGARWHLRRCRDTTEPAP